ncbi:ATP-binding protein [Bacillus suaedaesalsae]|uniref:ATP-binding protein n=1 Tax=Bacillus suaedaesalsae TaxID=2810349 RepID=A0ABS2DGM8_9BACI|nr:ATP-binding protein [Bacillus suaedaesalsae]MBM6617630.1 ATP-binding protein [Bacillus suaedaesalsae]
MPHVMMITCENDILHAISIAHSKMKEFPFSILEKQKVFVAISELCKNILIHSGTTGEVLIESIKNGIRITVIDNGIGIPSINAVLEGKNSPNSKGLGLGLRGVKRMMDVFIITSTKEEGTKIIIEKWCN